MVQRQLPRPAEIFELVRFKKPELDAKKRRLQAALTIGDLRAIARRRTPKAAFDYTEGAAEEEISLARARQAFRDIEFRPSILRGAAEAEVVVAVGGGRHTDKCNSNLDAVQFDPYSGKLSLSR